MTLSRTRALPYGVSSQLTSGEANDLNEMIEDALDKRPGEVDDLGSLITLVGGGRIVQAPVVGADADTTYEADAANRSIQITSAVTADRVYTLGNAAPVAGDRLMLFCDAAFAHEITVKNHDGTSLFALGFLGSSEGTWAEFIFLGADWTLLTSTGAGLISQTFTSSSSLVVPRNILFMDFEGVGGGGGGGGGRSDTGAGGMGAPGGGGAKRGKIRAAVVPGETITIVCGAAGVGGTGGDAAGSAGTNGDHGGDTTFTGSTSGLLATFRGAQGAIHASVAGFHFGGMPVRWSMSGVLGHDYPASATSPLTTAGGYAYPALPGPGQGGMSGASLPVEWKAGGGTAYNPGGPSGTVDSSFSGSGGSSEWEGGVGGTSVTFHNFAHTTNGGNGTLGAGGAGGSGGYAGYAGGNGGNGGVGAARASWAR